MAILARGSKLDVATSMAASTAVFTISATSTRVHAKISASSSSLLTPRMSAQSSTPTVTMMWIRMFRSVRTTWMMPSKA